MASVSIAADPGQVVATVGNHKITEKDLDAKIKPQFASVESQIYELKVQAIKAMADDYVLEQAAKKENLSPDGYLKKHLPGKPVTDTDAKLFYDQHKEIQQRYPKYRRDQGPPDPGAGSAARRAGTHALWISCARNIRLP